MYIKHLPLQDHPKFTQIRIFGLKIYHLATLASTLTQILEIVLHLSLSVSSHEMGYFHRHQEIDGECRSKNGIS
jgi:hypothetical protein